MSLVNSNYPIDKNVVGGQVAEILNDGSYDHRDGTLATIP